MVIVIAGDVLGAIQPEGLDSIRIAIERKAPLSPFTAGVPAAAVNRGCPCGFAALG